MEKLDVLLSAVILILAIIMIAIRTVSIKISKVKITLAFMIIATCTLRIIITNDSLSKILAVIVILMEGFIILMELQRIKRLTKKLREEKNS